MKLQHKKKKQAGIALMELMIALVILGIIAAGIAVIKPAVEFQATKKQTADGVDLIASQAQAFKGTGNYNQIKDISTLCNAGDLNETMCGTKNDGVGTNPFGGDWQVGPSSTFGAGHITVTVTGIPDSRFQELADTLAQRSYKMCQHATDCSSAHLTEPATDGTGGEISIDI